MKNLVVANLLIAIATSTAGCSKKVEDVMANANNNASAKQHPELKDYEEQKGPTTHGQDNGHGEHRHAFANPEELAKKWNASERDAWQHPEQIVDSLSLEPGATVADIGAGTGYMVAHLSNTVGSNGTVIAIDAESAMIEYLTEHNSQLGPATIVPKKVGFSDPELASASVDGVLTLDTWHHVANREAYARKVYDALKQGGRFVVVDFEVDADVGPPKAMRLSPGQVIEQLEAAGFRTQEFPESMPRHYIVVGTKA